MPALIGSRQSSRENFRVLPEPRLKIKGKMKLEFSVCPNLKTTIFNALTRRRPPPPPLEHGPHRADVPDPFPRPPGGDLPAQERPTPKHRPISPLMGGPEVVLRAAQSTGQMDGFLHVVRCSEDANVPHPAGSVNPARDTANMDSELLLNDLIAVEHNWKTGRGAARRAEQIRRSTNARRLSSTPV